jgi:uncharacterized membrane protein
MDFKLTKILQQPYPLFLEFSKSFPVIVGISVFIPLFLFTFKPFDLTAADIANRKFFLLGFGLVSFIVLFFNVYVLPRIFSNLFDEDRWNVGKEMGWILWNVFACVTASAFYEYIQPACHFSFAHLMGGYLKGFLMTIIPVTMVVLLAYLMFLKTKLRQAEEITRKLGESSKEASNEMVQFVSESGTEKVKVSANDLLFIQSSDNYSNIVWREDTQNKKTLIRSSLKRLEEQIPISYIIRCHRSFIVNLARVYSVSGNANGYRLYLKNHAEPIPVARRFGKPVLQVLEKISP